MNNEYLSDDHHTKLDSKNTKLAKGSNSFVPYQKPLV